MKVKLICPEEKTIEVQELPLFENNGYLLQCFDNLTISFFDQLSKKILSHPLIMRIPEMTALGFWIRRGNLLNIKEENKYLTDSKMCSCSPLGIVFHICPANVDTMFIYSLAVSVLLGNKNVLRISERMNAPHIQVLFTIINNLLDDEYFSVLRKHINIIFLWT